MNNHIICPHCKRSFPPEEGMKHQLEAERQKFIQQEEERLRKKIEEETSMKLKDKENETTELKEQNRKLQEQILETNKLLRQLQKQLEDKDAEVQKKLLEEEEKIKQEVRKKTEEEFLLKNREKDKKLEDALKLADEYKRKFEQGSQQTQGEVLEEYLESTLKTSFIYDEVQPVPKGIRGADVIQVVRNSRGSVAGKIIWESKRTKAWSNDWVAKLKEDKRSVGADDAILITNNLPQGVKHFGNYQGIWVADYDSIVGVATALRTLLLMVAGAKASAIDASQKKDLLFQYVHSTQFRNRIEAIADAFAARKDEIETEKKWFTKKWAREEKLISTLLENNLTLQGELEAITGTKMTEKDELQLLSGEEV